jgi:hypothetical protein
MRSVKRGRSTSKVEVTNISQHGFWLLMGGKEYFMPFEKFPWFRNACIEDITDVKVQKDRFLYWERLDIDLSLDIIQKPDSYPLVSKG